VQLDAMNKEMIQRLRDCIEETLNTNLFVEMIVPRLKRAWPECGSRRKLLQQVRMFAAENGWRAEIFDYDFRVRFAKR
jgi:hypothetical protein